MKRILLIDADSKLPNFSIMKESMYAKNNGDMPILGMLNPKYDFTNKKKNKKDNLFSNIPSEVLMYADEVHCSTVFSKSKELIENLLKIRPDINVGGTGWDIKKKLPNAIENSPPDYELYGEKEIYERIKIRMGKKENILEKARRLSLTGIGFASRGCVNSCSWCSVPAKEGALKSVSNLENLLNPKSKELILLDANITADSRFNQLMEEAIYLDIRINFSQGLDIRRISEEKAELLKRVKRTTDIHYSWDEVSAQNKIVKGILTLSDYIRPSKQTCYCLVGFNSTFENDLYRCRILQNMGVSPYIMIYRPDSPEAELKWKKEYPLAEDKIHFKVLRHLARYYNSHYYKSPDIPSFKDYEPLKRDGLASRIMC